MVAISEKFPTIEDSRAELAICQHKTRPSYARCTNPARSWMLVGGAMSGSEFSLSNEYIARCRCREHTPLQLTGRNHTAITREDAVHIHFREALRWADSFADRDRVYARFEERSKLIDSEDLEFLFMVRQQVMDMLSSSAKNQAVRAEMACFAFQLKAVLSNLLNSSLEHQRELAFTTEKRMKAWFPHSNWVIGSLNRAASSWPLFVRDTFLLDPALQDEPRWDYSRDCTTSNVFGQLSVRGRERCLEWQAAERLEGFRRTTWSRLRLDIVVNGSKPEAVWRWV